MRSSMLVNEYYGNAINEGASTTVIRQKMYRDWNRGERERRGGGGLQRAGTGRSLERYRRRPLYFSKDYRIGELRNLFMQSVSDKFPRYPLSDIFLWFALWSEARGRVRSIIVNSKSSNESNVKQDPPQKPKRSALMICLFLIVSILKG